MSRLRPLLLGVLLAGAGARVAAPTDAGPREVVVLYAERGVDVTETLRRGLRDVPSGVNIDSEYLDTARFTDKEYARSLTELYRRRYAQRRVDLVMTVLQPALRFMVDHGDEAFPDVPVVFFAVDTLRVQEMKLPPRVAGVSLRLGIRETVDAALLLQPDTSRVVVVSGSSPFDRYWAQRIRQELKPLEVRVEVEGLDALPMPELLERLRALPQRTVVLCIAFTQDGAGSVYPYDGALALVAAASRAPVYSVFGEVLGRGVVGGYVLSFQGEATRGAALARRILTGTSPAELGISSAQSNQYTFDWRELRRFGIPESRLPSGSVVRFRPPSIWELYPGHIAGGAVLLLAQAALIAALLAQRTRRRGAERERDERLRFETLLADLTTSLASAPVPELDQRIGEMLRRLAESLEADAAALGQFLDKNRVLSLTHSWAAEGMQPLSASVEVARFPWLTAQLLRGGLVRFATLDELPPEARVDRESFRAIGTRSSMAVPVAVGGTPIGALGVSTKRAERAFSDAFAQRLRLAGEILGSALMRQRFEGILAESQGFGSAVFASLHGYVAVIDRGGTIIAANEGWARFTTEAAGGLRVPIGADLLDSCRNAAASGDALAGEALSGLEAVLAGTKSSLSLEYRLPDEAGDRWFEMLAEPLRRAEGGAVVTHLDITDRKRVEIEAGRLREDMAHVTRVTTLGELAASLAHELNQPLTAILSNVQAAQMLLEHESPDVEEIREILAEVVADDQRAGDVIRRLRALFKKGERERVAVDVNEVIREVVRLVQNDTSLRGVGVALEPGRGLPPTRADRVQIQQVVLNLIMNALDATRDSPPGKRSVRVRTGGDAADGVWIEVQDSGPGIPPGDFDRIFEPFFTTKDSGMGMGLSIARSIVEAHGGRLSARNADGGGAVFRVVLPGVSDRGVSVTASQETRRRD